MAKIVLSGYYGFNNLGDEAILYSIVRTLKEIDSTLEIVILSGDPEKTRREFNEEGINAVNRWSMLETFRAISQCDLFISGGGSLLQDVSSSNGILYYLGLLWLVRLLDKPVLIYAQGIGPVVKPRNKRLVSWILNGVNKITVRDHDSKEDLIKLGIQQEITVTADPVFCLYKHKVKEKVAEEIFARYGISKQESGKLLGISIRPWHKNGYLPPLGEALRQMAEGGWKLVFVPMQFPADITIARELAHLLRDYDPVVLKEKFSPLEVFSLTSQFDILLGMRLHSLILAAVTGVPMVGLSYDPKIDRFLRQIGQVALFSTEHLDAQRLVEMLIWTDEHRTDMLKGIEARTQVLYQKAWQTARIAMSMVEGSSGK